MTLTGKTPLGRVVLVLLLAAMLLSQFAVPPQTTHGDSPPPQLTVYDDALSQAFVNYGWAQADLAESGTVRSGSRSILLDPDDGKALYFYKDRVMNAGEYDTLRFWVNGGEAGGQRFKLVLSLGGQGIAELESAALIDGGTAATGEWKLAEVKLAEAGVTGLLDGIWIWGYGSQAPIYIDDMAFHAAGAGGGTTGGGTGELPDGQPVTGLVFDEPQLVLAEGRMRTAVPTAVLADGTLAKVNAGIEWTSGDEAVATVSSGLITGRKPGATVVTARYEGLEAQLAVTVVEGTANPPIEPLEGLYLYDDALTSSMTDYSWASRDMADESVVHTGEKAIRFTPDGDRAIYLYNGWPFTTKDYEKLRLWVNGGSVGGQSVRIAFMAGGQSVAERTLAELLPDGMPADTWSLVEIPLAGLNLPGGLFDGLLFQGLTAGEQPSLYLDDIALTAKPVVQPKIAELRIDQPQVVLLPGDRQALEAEAFFATGLTEEVTDKAVWTSDRPELVSVEGGVLHAHEKGIARITAAYKTFTAEAYVQVTEVTAEPVYAEGLADGFRNLSWHEKDLANREQAHGGEISVKFEPDGWDGVWFAGVLKRNVADYYGFQFWIHGGASGGQRLLFHVYDGQNNVGNVDLSAYLPEGGLPAGTWTPIRVKLADLGLSDGRFDGVVFQAGTEANQGAVYIDDVELLKNDHPGELPEPQLPVVTVSVDPSADRRPINPEIYGINYDDMHPTDSQLAFPVQRWGGNNTTRYNWQLDTANRASDWYFINYPYENERPEQLPHGSTSDRFIDGVLGQGGNVLMTMPTIGWTPKDRTVSYGFSQRKYGAQQSGAQELPDAGNGVRPDGSLVTGNDPEDTSKRVGPEFITDWIGHIAERTGNGVHYYALDNEPEIWYVTHRDVHPNPPTYDELWSMTERYATAIKEKDPQAKIFGPTSWGWCAYFYSSADQCVVGPDRESHGNTPFLEWYLQQVDKHEQETGTRLLDYLDIHYYSQEDGVPTAEEGPAVAKRRFQALKSLYDPEFVDNSWIQEPIRLIPRMKEIIERNLPGTKLAITEYNFGNGGGITAGIAQAEALAIFGREGVDLATRFGTLPAGTPLEDAFKLYLDYDGNGSRIDGTSVKAASSLHDAVGSFAIEGTDGKLYTLLFNKDKVARGVEVSGAAGAGASQLYRFDAQTRLSLAGTVQPNGEGKLALKLPAYSATLIVTQQ